MTPGPNPFSPKRKRVNFAPAKRAITVQHTNMRISDVLTEKYELMYLPPEDPFSTACWHHEKAAAGHPARHVITFGANLANNMKEGCNLPDYAAAYHRHECAHSLYTERDLKALDAECNKRGVPFPMLNLFEDARIEAKYRGEYDEKFDWAYYEQVQHVDPALPTADRAAAVFSAMIQTEVDPELLAEAVKDVPTSEVDDIRAFYDRTCAAATSSEVLPIMEEFKAKYGVSEQMKQPEAKAGGAKATAGDLSASLAISSDPSKSKAFDEKVKESEKDEKSAAIGEKVDLRDRANGGVLTGRAGGVTFDLRRVQHLADLMASSFRAGPERYKRETPSKRVLVRDYMLGRSKIYRAKEQQQANRDVHVNLVFDCSGSMNAGDVLSEGRYMVLAISELAKRGILKGHLILSVVDARNDARQQSIDLKNLTPEIVSQIHAYGSAEGLKNALDSNREKLDAAHLTMVYTDGNICDEAIDRKEWHRRGVFTIGCYIGKSDDCPKLRNWFDAPLCRSTSELLAQGMAELVRSRVVMCASSKFNRMMERTHEAPLVGVPETQSTGGIKP